jgi:hypothetical protein
LFTRCASSLGAYSSGDTHTWLRRSYDLVTWAPPAFATDCTDTCGTPSGPGSRIAGSPRLCRHAIADFASASRCACSSSVSRQYGDRNLPPPAETAMSAAPALTIGVNRPIGALDGAATSIVAAGTDGMAPPSRAESAITRPSGSVSAIRRPVRSAAAATSAPTSCQVACSVAYPVSSR